MVNTIPAVASAGGVRRRLDTTSIAAAPVATDRVSSNQQLHSVVSSFTNQTCAGETHEEQSERITATDLFSRVTYADAGAPPLVNESIPSCVCNGRADGGDAAVKALAGSS
jgi:hypothetical protein